MSITKYPIPLDTERVEITGTPDDSCTMSFDLVCPQVAGELRLGVVCTNATERRDFDINVSDTTNANSKINLVFKNCTTGDILADVTFNKGDNITDTPLSINAGTWDASDNTSIAAHVTNGPVNGGFAFLKLDWALANDLSGINKGVELCIDAKAMNHCDNESAVTSATIPKAYIIETSMSGGGSIGDEGGRQPQRTHNARSTNNLLNNPNDTVSVQFDSAGWNQVVAPEFDAENTVLENATAQNSSLVEWRGLRKPATTMPNEAGLDWYMKYHCTELGKGLFSIRFPPTPAHDGCNKDYDFVVGVKMYEYDDDAEIVVDRAVLYIANTPGGDPLATTPTPINYDNSNNYPVNVITNINHAFGDEGVYELRLFLTSSDLGIEAEVMAKVIVGSC